MYKFGAQIVPIAETIEWSQIGSFAEFAQRPSAQVIATMPEGHGVIVGMIPQDDGSLLVEMQDGRKFKAAPPAPQPWTVVPVDN